MDATSRAQIIVTAKDEASAVIKGIGDAAKKVKPAAQEGAQGFDAMGMAGKALGAIGLNLSLAGIATGAIAAGKAAIDLGMQAEQTSMAFETLIGSASGAQKHLDELRAFAATTPFEFNDLTAASRKLQAFGFGVQEVVPMMTAMGDAVAAMGGGAAQIDRVTLAIGQMNAKGKVSAGEMLQLTEAGIPAWKYLAEAMGVSTAEVMKLSERGLIPAEKAIQSILDGMSKDFGGMMKKQADTAAGAMSNLTDAVTRAMTNWGVKWNPVIKDFANATSSMINFQTNLTQAVDDGVISQQDYSAILTKLQYGLMSQADVEKHLQDLYKEKNRLFDQAIAITKQMDETTAEAAREAVRFGEAQQELTDKLGPTKQELEMNKAAVDALNAVMAGAVGNELKSFAEKQTELKDKAEEYKQKIEELEQKPYLTDAQRTELDDTKTKLGDVNTALGENATAHEEAMKRIVFSMLQGQLATDGFTTEEVAALTTVAEKWGLIDPATKAATDAISLALSETAANGDWENLDERIDNITNGLLGIPNTIDIAINFRRNVYGDLPPEAGDIGLPGGDSAPVTYGNVDSDNGSGGGDSTVPHAFGGVAVPGLQHVMNESIYSRPETFVTGQVGTVFTRQQMEAALSGGGGGGNELLLAEMRSLPRTIARALRDQLQFLPR